MEAGFAIHSDKRLTIVCPDICQMHAAGAPRRLGNCLRESRDGGRPEATPGTRNGWRA